MPGNKCSSSNSSSTQLADAARHAERACCLASAAVINMQAYCWREVASRWRFLISGATACFSGHVAVPVDQQQPSTRKATLKHPEAYKPVSKDSRGCTRQENLPLQRSCSIWVLRASSRLEKLQYFNETLVVYVR
jgi:hypothetical protein